MKAPLDHMLRLALAIAASLVVSQLTAAGALRPATLLGGLCFLAALVRLPRERRTLLRRLLTVNGFVLMVWLTLPWSFSTAGVTLSGHGLELAAQISLRTNAIALVCIGLLAGMDAFAVARAAAGLGLPPKLARLLALTVRYLGVIDDTRQRIDLAMRARGFRPGANRRGFTVLAQQLALILVHAMLRAERIELAMRARAFAPQVLAPAAGPRWVRAAGGALACACLLWLVQ